MRSIGNFLLIGGLVAAVCGSSGCKKKLPVPPPPPITSERSTEPPAQTNRPQIRSFTASPESIRSGEAASLSWRVSEAEHAEITPGPGRVELEGRAEVRPTETTEYTLRATGPGGTASATVRIAVSAVPTPADRTTSETSGLLERLSRELEDIYFDFDKSSVGADGMAGLKRNAQALSRILEDFPGEEIVLEGHCDERGSAEYNLGLGDRRAASVQETLATLGLRVERLRPISLGKERPQCTDGVEDCWRRNRRVHFTAASR